MFHNKENNVGIRRYEPVADAPWQAWDDILRINLLSFVSMARAALPALRRSGSRSIINVSSTGAVYAPRQSQPHSDGDS